MRNSHGKSSPSGHGNSFSNGIDPLLCGPPLTITGVQLGRPQDDRFGG